MSTELTSVTSTGLAAPGAALALPPQWDFTVELITKRVVSSMLDTIYWYERGNGKLKRQDCAMIVRTQGKSTFKLQYYPIGQDAQIVKELPLDQLQQAQLDLSMAGFPHRKIPKKTPVPLKENLSMLPAVKGGLSSGDERLKLK